MSELEYSNQYAAWLTAAGLTPNSNPINLRGVVHQILENLGGGGGTGTVTTVSVVSANGLAGTVATATTTPAITLSTSITGILKGNATAISAATAGTDYLLPSNNLSDVPTKGTGRANLRVPTLAAVQAAATANVNIASAPASVDGFSFVSSGLDTMLLTGQSTSSQNGTWVWNGTGSALTRPSDFPSGFTLTTGRTVEVQNGTVNKNSIWSLSVASAGLIIDTNPQTWTAIVQQPANVPVGPTYTYSAVTSDPNPGAVGTYYHVALASTGNFTLPTGPATGAWLRVKNASVSTTVDMVGTVDGSTSFTVPPLGAQQFVYNGTTWDAN